MTQNFEDVIVDLNDKLQDLLSNDRFMVIGGLNQLENAVFQIKKDDVVLDIGIFGDVDDQDITTIKQNEERFSEEKKLVESDIKSQINQIIQRYLITRKFKIICWCVEPEEESDNFGISIGFKKDNILYAIAITEEDFLFGVFKTQIPG